MLTFTSPINNTKLKTDFSCRPLKNALSLQPSGGSIQTGTPFDYQYSSFGSLNKLGVSKSMRDFAAIDFETANNERSSVCSVGIVIVRNGEIVDTFYSLIQPEPNYYNYWCSQVHGLCRQDTDDAPVFPKVWAQIEPLIQGLPLVAHNKPFDEGCLKAVFRVYQMDYPDYEFYDTLAASRRAFRNLPNYQLHTVAAECGYCLENHHHALADAEACAAIAVEIL